MSTIVERTPTTDARSGHIRQVPSTIALLPIILLLGIPGGIVVAHAAAGLEADTVLTAATCVALALPAIFAAARMRHSRHAVIPLIVGIGFFYLFAPRLLAFDPSSGLVSQLPLTPQEISHNTIVAEVALIAFCIPISIAFFLAPPVKSPPWRDTVDVAHRLRAGLRLRTALVLGTLGSLAALINGLRLGTEARTFRTGDTSSPLGLLAFFSITVPAALWLARYRRASIMLLAFSMIGPYLEGGRQAVLTPLLLLIIVAVGTGRREAARPRRIPVRLIVISGILAIVVVATIIATTSRRAEVETAVHGGVRPSLTTTLIDDQTLFDPLLIAVAREPRPQGMNIYSRVISAPIPRALWPQKPLSYDYEFRQRHFAQYEDAIPISLVGTSFVSFALPGAVAAGLIVAVLALTGEALLARLTLKSVLMAALLAILAFDLLRIGGFYRELLTFSGSAVGVLLIAGGRPRSVQRVPHRVTDHRVNERKLFDDARY